VNLAEQSPRERKRGPRSASPKAGHVTADSAVTQLPPLDLIGSPYEKKPRAGTERLGSSATPVLAVRGSEANVGILARPVDGRSTHASKTEDTLRSGQGWSDC